ncbi:peptidyl-prolyl cis-trans isomerase FKBP5-like isoform X2 [Tubulanus polymorphus]|uniref:peptidyl-prolyl cis-trans isomerase FKBP5-like isoform X2 n=1 Tax=Tubulanus polymorphus TaxID=672921 RepID=UPI003DA3B456
MRYLKEIKREGHGFSTPKEFSICSYSTCDCVDDLLDDDKKNEEIGVNRNDTFIELELIYSGLESHNSVIDALSTMKPGEISAFVPTTEDGDRSRRAMNLHLKSFTNAKSCWEYEKTELFAKATRYKTDGSVRFKAGDIRAAFALYGRALKWARLAGPNKDLNADESKLISNCYLNLSFCQIKRANFRDVIRNCSKALSIDGSNVKGLYRRALASAKLNKLDQAKDDLVRAASVEPNNRAVIDELAAVNKLLSESASRNDDPVSTGMKKFFNSEYVK